MTEGFAAPLAPPAIPGPTLYAEVGDTIVVHFRNGLSEKTGQALTMHPHGVKYNPEYDGVFLGDFTRAGGFVRPGREFTYTWEATPDAVGVWPYHDHGPNHTLNTFRGLFGAIIVRERGEKAARRRGRRSSSTRWRRRSPASSASSSASTAAPSPATRRRCRPRSARTSPST